MACSSTCPTQDHTTLGECLRAKGVKVRGASVYIQAAGDKRLSAYEKARKDGIQPQSTRSRDIERAVRISEATGTAFRADAE